MINEQNNKNKTLSRDEIVDICANTFNDLMAEPTWHTHQLGCKFGCEFLASDYENICNIMEQNGMDSTALRKAKKLVDDEYEVVYCSSNSHSPYSEDLKKVDELDREFIDELENSCMKICKTLGIKVSFLYKPEPFEPSAEEDSDDKEYLPFC